MPTFRRVPPDAFPRYHQLLEYAFQIQNGPQRYADGDVPSRISERWGLFDEDELLTTCGLYEFDMRLRGAWATIGGLAAVASPPEHRRHGYVREMVAGALSEYRDREITMVTLWPFDHDFYRRMGWATANKFTRYEFAPEGLDGIVEEARGTFEQVDAEQWERLEAIQVAHGAGTTLSRRREEQWWRERVFDYGDEEPYVYVWSQDGEDRGYIAYTASVEGDQRSIRVIEASHTDHEAYRQLMWFLRTHETQVQQIRLYRPEETMLKDMVTDPEAIDCEVNSGPMIRLCDVQAGLTALPYPEAASERVVLDVSDPLVSWNDETVALTVENGEADCVATEEPPDARVSVGTLSQLAVGYHDTGAARKLGDLDCDEETAANLSRLFPPERVCLREFF